MYLASEVDTYTYKIRKQSKLKRKITDIHSVFVKLRGNYGTTIDKYDAMSFPTILCKII